MINQHTTLSHMHSSVLAALQSLNTQLSIE